MAHNNSELPDPLSIMGMSVTPFDSDSYSHAVRCISSRIVRRQRTFCVAVNPEKVHCSFYDPALKDLLNSADVQLCDGIGVGLAAKILHGRYVPRCTGIDLFVRLVKSSVESGWRIFLLGGAEEVNESTYKKLKEQYPGIKIVGRSDGYFNNVNSVIEQINDSDADILFVAMGSPMQELWIHKHMNQINASFFLGVGGTFDVVSGRIKRAPSWMRKMGLEFFYRFCQFPARWKRLHRRPLFALQVFIEKIRQVLGLPCRFEHSSKQDNK